MFKQIRTKGNNHQNVMEERKMGKYTQGPAAASPHRRKREHCSCITLCN